MALTMAIIPTTILVPIPIIVLTIIEVGIPITLVLIIVIIIAAIIVLVVVLNPVKSQPVGFPIHSNQQHLASCMAN